MKKYLNILGIVLTTTIVFSSCDKQIESPEKNVPTESENEVLLTINTKSTSTKTFVDGTSVKWASTGEYLYVFELATPTEGEIVTTSKKSSQGTTTDEGATMSFVTSLAEKSTGYTNFDYYALYPSTSRQSGDSPTSVNIELSASQTPTATSFDPKADILIAQPSTGNATQVSSLNLSFTRAAAVGKMTITNLPTNEAVTEVRFSAEDSSEGDINLAGRTSFNLATASPVSNYGNNTALQEICLDYSKLSLTADSSMDVFFTCFPFELEAGDSFTVTVKTTTYTYTRKVTLTGAQALAFSVGKASRFSVSMSGVVPTINAQDIPYAILSFDAAVAGGLDASYVTRYLTDIVGGKWEYNAYKSTGIQIKNCKTDANKTSYIKLPVFKDNIRKVVINLAASYDSKYIRFDSSADSYAGGIYSLALDDNTSYTLTSTELGSINTAYIHAYDAAINFVSIEVYAGEDNAVKLSTPTGVTAALTDDGAGGSVPNSITVSWSSVTNADYYVVTLTPTSGDVFTSTVRTTYATISDLNYEKTYSVSVVAWGDNKGLYSPSDAGSCSSVTTGSAPSGSKSYSQDFSTAGVGGASAYDNGSWSHAASSTSWSCTYSSSSLTSLSGNSLNMAIGKGGDVTFTGNSGITSLSFSYKSQGNATTLAITIVDVDKTVTVYNESTAITKNNTGSISLSTSDFDSTPIGNYTVTIANTSEKNSLQISAVAWDSYK